MKASFLRARIAAIILVFFVGYGFLLFSGTFAAAQDGNMQAKLQATDPRNPSLTLTNTTDAECQLADTAFGTVSLTEVKQNGASIDPILFDVAADESIPLVLSERLVTLQPGQSQTIPLSTVESADGYVLESVTWSEGTGVYGLAYKIDPHTPLEGALTYSTPLDISEGAPICPFVSAVSSNDSNNLHTWLLYGLFIVLVIIAVVVVVWLARRHRRVVTVAVLFLFMSSHVYFVLPVGARITGTGAAQSQYDACMSILEEHNDITGEVLTTVSQDGVNIVLRPNNDGINDTVDYRGVDGNIYIYWDPDTIRTYRGAGGQSSPCDSLYHEMFHAHEILWGILDTEECGNSGIRTSEVNATRAQNVLRERLGLPQRSHYGNDALPSGDCNAPARQQTCENDGCGQTNGDPHLQTFDGLRYDFQAVGEFTLAEDTSSQDFAVQVRQTAWPNSRQVAVNTAVAARIGDDTVEITMQNQTPTLFINGVESAFESTALATGGELTIDSRNIKATWPDGSNMIVRSIGSFGMHVMLSVADDRKSNMQGLLGNYNGDAEDDLYVKDSQQNIEPEFDQLYPTFADSWRITNESSLFTYGEATTETYTDRHFPDSTPDIQSLPGRAVAEQLCRRQGVSDPIVLQECILDVALTGRAEFAAASAAGQSFTAYAQAEGETWHVAVTSPGEVATVEFAAKAGEKLFFDLQNTTIPNQCGAVKLMDDAGRTLKSGCIADGSGFIDRTELDRDGDYHIMLDPADDATGEVIVRKILIHDQESTISPDGDAVTAVVSQPGAISRLRFEGAANQRVFVEVLQSNFPGQCGTLTLNSLSQRLASGCFADDGYIDTYVLQEDGEYAVIVDPAERAIGAIDVRIVNSSYVTREVSVDDPPLQIDLSKAGSIADITFRGAAGQRITIDISSTTLSGQCGTLVLHGPDSQRLSSGCIMGGRGNVDTVLAQDGIYTLQINPARATAGMATLRITSN